jgi:hypothetical protein
VSVILNETFDDCSPADAIAPDGVTKHLKHLHRIFTGARHGPTRRRSTMTTLASVAPAPTRAHLGNRDPRTRALRPAVRVAGNRGGKREVVSVVADGASPGPDAARVVASLAAAVAVMAHDPLPAIAAFGQSTIELNDLTYKVVESPSGNRSMTQGKPACLEVKADSVNPAKETTYNADVFGRVTDRGGDNALDNDAASDAGRIANIAEVPPGRVVFNISVSSQSAELGRVRTAAEELVSLQASLKTSSTIGTSLPLKELKSRLTAGSLSELPDIVLKLDRLIDSTPLEDWETTAWTSVLEETQGSNFRNRTGWNIPGVERTNDFLCAVFSCFNDPRAPPSTDMMLSLKLLSEGVNMGLRGDSRISAEGLILSLDDVLEKVNAYVNLVDRSLTP